MSGDRKTAIGLLAGHGMAMALAAMIRGAEPALPSNKPFLPKPPHERDITPRQERARENQRNQTANRKRRAERRDPIEAARQRGINAMTNWQRTQWARAGYPYDVAKYETMERRVS